MDSKWRRTIAAGSVVIIDGRSYLIEAVANNWVTLRAHDGAVLQMPLPQLWKRTQTESPPPSDLERAQNVWGRMSDGQRARVAGRKAILRWYESGLRPEQGGEESPDSCHDPLLVPSRQARIAAMARVIASREEIKVESAARYVRRILERATTGEAGLVDPRLLAPTRMRKHDEIEGAVRDFMLDRVYQSTVTHVSVYVAFSAWHLREYRTEAPAQRTFERAREQVLRRYPHLALSAKSRESVAVAPKVASERRHAIRVGEHWLLDSTPSNVKVRDPYAPSKQEISFRLVFTRLIDGASRHQVGRSMSKDVNGFAAGLALADAFRRLGDDRDAIVYNGRTYPRPFVGLPQAISRWPIAPRRLLTDNGREFLNKQTLLTLHRLAIDVEPMRVRDGRGKARIERLFGTNRTGFEEQQFNYLSHAVWGRGSEADANVILTWDQLEARDDEFMDLYNVTEHRGLWAETGRRISPVERWIELAEEFGVTELPSWRNEWIRFLPNQVLALDPYGVVRRDLVYNAPIIRALIDSDGAAPSGKVRVFWDPNDLRQVYCFDPEGNAYEIPWVHRTEDSAAISDVSLDWARGRLEGTALSKREYRKRLIGLVVHWQTEDVVLLAQLRGRKTADEILASQLDAIRSADLGQVIEAETFLSPETIDAMQAGPDNLELDDEGLELLADTDDNLFVEFD